MALWRFRAHQLDEKFRNPIQGEFFSEEAVERPAQSLVREVIQNSLDARTGPGPVELRFTVSEPGGLGEKAARAWLGGAWKHLRAEGSGLRGIPPEPSTGRFLSIEDFGTTGLDGDPAELRPEGSPSRLFAFFRAEGISQKGGKDGGRWGVGKTVFLRSSEVNSILCLTVRSSDGRRLVFGQSVLRYHRLDGTHFTPDGAFGEDAGGAIVPSEDPSIAERLAGDFALARRSEPGLSVVVPYASEELTGTAILQAVILEYYYPILSGHLTVTVVDPALPGSPKVLTADSLLEELVTSGPELAASIGPLASLAVWLEREGLGGAVALEPPVGSPKWTTEMLTAPVREALSGPFRRGDTLLLRVPLTVHPVGEPAQETFFHVVLRRDLADRGAAPAFVRNGIQIPKALERRVRGQNLWALVLIEDQPIATLLGDAETPAHTHWSKDTQNFRHKYRYGAATIDFVRTAPRFLAETLAESGRERDLVSLADFFPVPAPGPGSGTPTCRGEKVEDGLAESPPGTRPAAERFRVERLDGGFRVAPGPGAAGNGGFSISVAYDCTRGDPLKRWDARDFDLATLPRTLTGASLVRCEGNGLTVLPEAVAYRLEVTGFDPNRDLYLRLSALEEPDDPEV